MQTTIYYFSGTGNSLKSARELAAKPVRSIQYGQKTIKRNRYHHPDITVEDIMEQK